MDDNTGTTTTTAATLLSGRFKPDVIIGEGLTLDGSLKPEQELLKDSLVIEFPGEEGSLKFRSCDKWSLDCIFQHVQQKLDEITSGGTCNKPLFSPSSGHKYAKKSQGLKGGHTYIYEFEDLRNDKAKLPFFLYLRETKTDDRPYSIQILSHPIQIHLVDDYYLSFEPHNISVPEVIAKCTQQLIDLTSTGKAQSMSIKKDIYGITTATLDEPSNFSEQEGVYMYNMVDLLLNKATLPARLVNGKKLLTEDVGLIIGGRTDIHEAGTDVEALWGNYHRDIGHNTISFGASYIEGKALLKQDVFRLKDLITGKAVLGSVKGFLLSTDSIIQFEDNTHRLYKKNSVLSEVLLELSSLYRMAKPLDRGYRIVMPDGSSEPDILIVHSPEELRSLVNKDGKITKTGLIMGSNNVRPIIILKDFTRLIDANKRYQQMMKDSAQYKSEVDHILNSTSGPNPKPPKNDPPKPPKNNRVKKDAPKKKVKRMQPKTMNLPKAKTRNIHRSMEVLFRGVNKGKTDRLNNRRMQMEEDLDNIINDREVKYQWSYSWLNNLHNIAENRKLGKDTRLYLAPRMIQCVEISNSVYNTFVKLKDWDEQGDLLVPINIPTRRLDNSVSKGFRLRKSIELTSSGFKFLLTKRVCVAENSTVPLYSKVFDLESMLRKLRHSIGDFKTGLPILVKKLMKEVMQKSAGFIPIIEIPYYLSSKNVVVDLLWCNLPKGRELILRDTYNRELLPS